MQHFGSCSDDFYVNLNVNTEMELNQNRESVLHYFEQLKKRFPEMRNFYSRDVGEFVLEEDKDGGHYRWSAVEPKRISSGYVNPATIEDAVAQHETVLGLLPFVLSMSPLDCESVNLMYGFDFTCRGNHNELVADALGLPPALDTLMDEMRGAKPIAYEPSLQFALDDDCRLQCRISVETRTSAYHVRADEFPEDQISVYVTARRFGSLDTDEDFVQVMKQLNATCLDVVESYVIERLLVPLQQAISMR